MPGKLLIAAVLRCCHQALIDSQFLETILASYLVHEDGDLFSHLLKCGGGFRCFSSVRSIAVHVHRSVPIHIEPDHLAHICKFDIVVAVDDICFHLNFFPIQEELVGAANCSE